MKESLSRRDLFESFLKPWKGGHAEPAETSDDQDMAGVAILNEEHCLAFQRSFCSSCRERCPEPGAIVASMGKPIFQAEHCTGCGVCVEVCPAPLSAITIS
ncbi:4Fe-4S binding protein [Rubritalea marina]|uniref:4Fe-4S binding protein n=1 Tax=Rubritalea marina TaxID=361055 RepID=UPI0009FDD90F|nr:4Fe-4S binding protein [Rubritalea marina]